MPSDPVSDSQGDPVTYYLQTVILLNNLACLMSVNYHKVPGHVCVLTAYSQAHLEAS